MLIYRGDMTTDEYVELVAHLDRLGCYMSVLTVMDYWGPQFDDQLTAEQVRKLVPPAHHAEMMVAARNYPV